MCVFVPVCLSAYVYLCLCDCMSVICCVYMWINSKKPESVIKRTKTDTFYSQKVAKNMLL